MHATDEVFDFLEALDLDDGNLKNAPTWIIDAIVLCSVLVNAKCLREAGASSLYFASTDEVAFLVTPARPKLARYYTEVGLVFVPRFVLPDSSPPPA